MSLLLSFSHVILSFFFSFLFLTSLSLSNEYPFFRYCWYHLKILCFERNDIFLQVFICSLQIPLRYVIPAITSFLCLNFLSLSLFSLSPCSYFLLFLFFFYLSIFFFLFSLLLFSCLFILFFLYSFYSFSQLHFTSFFHYFGLCPSHSNSLFCFLWISISLAFY